ncbi:MAG: thioredoxin domain-containing protein [Gammaproteobacteria bacterium]|nr:thioredoxin domain-containing protein [Gammaproteobacteria bacterium]
MSTQKKATYVVIPLAFLPNSAPAGNAALCVFHQSPALFFDYIDHLYRHQPDEALDWATSDILLNFAEHVTGINLGSLQECMEQHQYYTQLQQNLSLASHIMGDTVQTPSLYINGRIVSPLTKEEIDRMVAESRNLE